MRQALLAICLAIFFVIPLAAQSHTSVSLNDQIYHILEQAEMRGLITPLSGVRPYTRAVVARAINELLDLGPSNGLRPLERQILEDHLARFDRPEPGFDRRMGTFFAETTLGERELPISFNMNLGMDFELSSAFVPTFGETHMGGEFWLQIDFSGDIGRHVSFGFYNQGGVMRQPRRFLGWYNTYYAGFDRGPDSDFQNELFRVYSEPLTHFPFSYRGRWDGSVFPLDDLGDAGFGYWPEGLSGGYSLQSEVTASFLEDRFIMRLGRIPREWGSMPLGTSLIFNSMARPFIAAEFEFRPFSWFSFSSITGVLEYHNRYNDVQISPRTFQNAFSMTMIQLRFRNFLFLDLMDAVIWPSRFELAYLSPISINFFSQNHIGDFDNMALSINLRAQYPGLGNVWFSLFMDEMSIERNMFQLARTMTAYQIGINIPMRFRAFSSLRFSYTRINPFAYTHNRRRKPWYGENRMETGWVNHGVPLGHYLPPNSDEFLVQFRTMPARNVSATLQYQMIRRGANFGSRAVMGSDWRSELNPDGRSEDPTLRRFFLRDGAYQWMHIVRASADWNLPNLPVSLFGEAGMVFSYFTDTVGYDVHSGYARPFRRINTPEYPMSTTFIVRIGFRLFR